MKPVVGNDEVAAILRGLQLDKHFFQSRIRPEPLQELTPAPPRESESDVSAPSLSVARNSRKSRLTTTVIADPRSLQLQADKSKDFDIYLNEALMPALAQALDCLCRQINRMEEQGDRLDPRVRERFNPLTWLGQQLLRSHPKCARTPRRQAIYKDFKDWGDQERGRREMLRRKDIVAKVFNGFMLRGTVRNETVPNVLKAIDDTLHLQGVLNGHSEVQRVLGVGTKSPSPRGSTRSRVSVFKGPGPNWTFARFWYQLSHVIIQHDVVPYTAIDRGIKLQKQELAERAERVEAARKVAEERQKYEAEQQRQVQEYVEIREPLLADKHIQDIIEENKILTGDDVRPGDAGYEMEVPPKGSHVSLLLDFLVMLGFGNIYKDPETPFGERWWTADLASSWIVLQEMFKAELTDGVVEREVLERVLVPPDGFLLLKQKVEDEFEQRAENPNGEGQGDEMDIHAASANAKPSMEELCERSGITQARMDWLYDLFESYVQKEDVEEMTKLPQKYPEHSLALTKDQMRPMIEEMKPDITPAEFEARFHRIDEDGSGEIEFDEFVTWIHEDEVHVKQCKMTMEELAVAHDEPIESIQYLHNSFQREFPPGEVDGYPMQPVGLPKDSVRRLISTLTPSVSDSDFARDFDWADIDQKGQLNFDQFLDLLDWGQLPDELP